MYDVSTPHFETDTGDGFREPGFSKERRLDPQITIGLLTDASGFPLMVHAFEGNKAETKQDVTVHATWTLPDGTTRNETATTKGSGSAGFDVADGAGTYTLTITGVTKAGHTFDADDSVLEASVTN
jgi:hypothetical protein